MSLAANDARQGSGSLTLLTGEAGIGKTSVVRALARRVRGDLDVSWGTCVPDRSAPPFWPWRELLSTELSVADTSAADQAIGAPRFDRLNDLRAELAERTRREALLHVIEDLQWADVASVLLLAHVGAAIAAAPLMIVATLRTSELLSRALDDAIEQVRRIARVRAVPALHTEEVEVLIREAGIDRAGELAPVLQDRTGGNPLYVTELLRDMRGSGTAERRELAGGSVPARVTELVGSHLARLPAAVADFVFTASVVGSEGDARTLANVADSTVASVIDLVEQARAAHLLDAASPGRWRFRHSLVRDAVYASGTDANRARLHAAVLEALAADGSTPPAVLARHALDAQPLFDAERAVALAARAGEAAFAQQAYEESFAWFERALVEAPVGMAPRWRAELLVQCGDAHRHLGEIEEARRSFVDAAELTDDPALLARAALGYADPGADLGIAYRTEDPMTLTLLERAIAAQPVGDGVTSVLLESRLAAELYFSDEPGRARELCGSALERARRLGDRRALGAASAVNHDAHVVGQSSLDDQLRSSDQLLTWARDDGSAGALLTAHRARIMDLLSAGDLAAMDTEILAFRRIADPLKAPAYQWWLALWSAMRALLEGRHDEAEARAFAAFAIGEQPFPVLAFTNLSFLLFFLRREQGRFDEMEQATRDYASSRADIPAIRVALMFLLAEIGKVDEAHGMLQSISSRDLQRLHDRNWPASWFQLARAASIVGDKTLAATLLGEADRPTERCVMVSLATACLGATDLATGWLLHTVGDLDAAHDRFESAAATNAAVGARSWLAQTRVDHAVLLLDRNRPGDADAARAHIDRAAAAAEDIGLPSVIHVLADVRHRLEHSAKPSSTTALAPSTFANVFRPTGAVWEIDFAGRSVQVPHTRGMRDLAFLLARPDQSVSVLELLGGTPTPAETTRGAPALDEKARLEIRDRLRDLDAEVDEAEANNDLGRATKARERRQLLAEAVARDLGLGGKARLIGDPIERARKTVSTRIRRTIAALGRTHPELGRHLERSIDTGAWCAYRPAEPITWTT
ncbi:MAG: AAA family ATPase [Actinobacteria bacterium]|nr:AAA family ATPase [Actinomycetota bacterium]